MLLLASCTKTGPQGESGANGATGPAGPGLTNTLTGYVFLYDAYGDPVANIDSTVSILLYNTTTGGKIDSVNANHAGVYTSTVQTGTYNLVGECPGYGINKTNQNVVFTGGTRTYDLKFSAIPPLYAATGYDSIGTNYVYVKGTVVAPNSRSTTIIAYIGATSAVNASVPGSYSFVTVSTIAANATKYSILVPLTTIYDYFQSGASAYVSVYGAANNYTYGDYTDYASGNVVYTPVSSTSVNAGSFIVP
jgi:hypothetical protein